LEKTEGDIKELSESAVNLKSNYLELTELKLVLEKTQTFFSGQNEANGLDSAYKSLIADDLNNLPIGGQLGFVAGVINRERVPGFERMLWRVSRGNIFLRQVEIDEPLKDPATVRMSGTTNFLTNIVSIRVMKRTRSIAVRSSVRGIGLYSCDAFCKTYIYSVYQKK
jgi:vacuolar-type H+-ATPase subunit I/STV1